MSANRFGTHFQISTYGESHGNAMGVLIEGCPAGVSFDPELLQNFLDRRKPGQSEIVTQRKEPDQAEVLSGVLDNKTLGSPISILVRNQDVKSEDYKDLKPGDRVGHADDVWRDKFQHSDIRGGGRASGRETLARVLGGAVAQMFCLTVHPDLKLETTIEQIGPIKIKSDKDMKEAQNFLKQARIEGQSYGGIGAITVKAVPKSLGQPVFRKLKSDLASAMMGIGATTGFQFGSGFESVDVKGTDFHSQTKVYGGIRGGISTGEDIYFQVAFKPTSSVMDIAKQGRHDPCIVIRALPVMEAMTWLVMADHILWSRLDRV